MDHKVSKDMISSGMIPSGEKTQADLGRTQYGSAPSPSKLMDAYKSMYEHHKKDADGNTIPHEGEELNEGKIPAGLQAYLDKKKGKKEDKKEMKEGMGLYANIHAKRKRGGKMRKKGAKGAPSSQDFANAAKTAKEEVEMKEGLATAAKTAFSAVKKMAGKMAGKLGKTATAAAKEVNNSSFASDMVRGAAQQFGANMVSGGMGGGGQEKKTGQRTAQYQSADLFDIVKGQLLDEGLSEEEIRDIMLTLTPDEILNEMGDYPAGKGANYRETPKVPEKKKLGGRTDGTAGSYVEKPKPTVSQMNARAKQEQNRQKFNDPSGVKNTNIGGRGKDLG